MLCLLLDVTGLRTSSDALVAEQDKVQLFWSFDQVRGASRSRVETVAYRSLG